MSIRHEHYGALFYYDKSINALHWIIPCVILPVVYFMNRGILMKLIAVKCPQCDATIDIDENRKSCFCSFCGAKILIDDGSRTYTHVFIDKTKEKELELEK